jgi:hypothetical protein
MTTAMSREYWRLRALGWRAQYAFHAARVNVRFEEAERRGLVRFIRQGDDTMTLEDLAGEGMSERQMLDFAYRVDTEGAWYVGTEFQIGGRWAPADSVGGFVGDDWKDSGYDVDMREAALERLAEATTGRCKGRSPSTGGMRMNTREATAKVNALWDVLYRICESSTERDRLLYRAHQASLEQERGHRRFTAGERRKAGVETCARYFVLKWLCEGHVVRGRERGPKGWLEASQIRDDARLAFALRELLRSERVYPFGTGRNDPLAGIEYTEHFA